MKIISTIIASFFLFAVIACALGAPIAALLMVVLGALHDVEPSVPALGFWLCWGIVAVIWLVLGRPTAKVNTR